MRKKVLTGVVLLLFLCVLSGFKSMSAAAPSETAPVTGAYPNQNVYGTIVYAPGGACDTFARALAPLVQENFGQTIIMNNVIGGSGAIGLHHVYNQAADGYTLLFAAEGQQLFPLLGVSDLSYNNYIPIGIYASCNAVVFVNRDSPYHTLEELADAILANPGKIKMGNSGAGGVAYVFSAIMNKLTGAEMNEIPFNGENPCKAAVLGGQVDFTVTTYIACKSVIDAGLVRPLAVVSDQRQAGLEHVPALSEIYPEYLSYVSLKPFYGAYVKEGTPAEIVGKLQESFRAGIESAKFEGFLAEMGAIQLRLYGDEAREFLDTYQQLGGWTLYDAGSISISPESLGLERPGD